MSNVGTLLYRASMLLIALSALAFLASIEAEVAALFLIARDLRPVQKAPPPPANVPPNPTRVLHPDPLPDCPA